MFLEKKVGQCGQRIDQFQGVWVEDTCEVNPWRKSSSSRDLKK